MITLKHTKGPWRLLPEEVGRSYIRVRGTRLGSKFKIANVLTYENATGSEVTETRANAQLIMAAPALLEACIALQSEAKARGCGLRVADDAIELATKEENKS